MNEEMRTGNGKDEKDIRGIEKEGLLRFNDSVTSKNKIKEKKWVKHNSTDENRWLGESSGGVDGEDGRWRSYCFPVAGIENKVER